MVSADQFTVGTATASPGEIVYGELPVLDHPTGGQESLPVIIAQGREAGPTLWLTANIHGAELTGLPVIHYLVSGDLAGRLRGTLVAIPSLNPAGLRTAQRLPYYSATDPNRLWPAKQPQLDEVAAPPSTSKSPCASTSRLRAAPTMRLTCTTPRFARFRSPSSTAYSIAARWIAPAPTTSRPG
jgi:predicted deacylase